MRKAKIFAAALMAMSSLGAFAQHQFTVQANKPGAEIQPTMYGIFFEDINFGADGGLYAEMVENRSFEFPQRLMGWNTFGNVTLSDVKPAFDRNPHYVTLESAGAREKQTGLENRGFFGMGLKKDMKYDFSVYGRLHLIDGKQGKIRVELVNSKNDVIAKQVINITNNKWQKLTATLTSPQTDAKGLMRVYLEKGSESVDLDHISLFPEDNWNGLRADLVQDLADLKPGIFRFPGGCIVEGTDLDTRYEWKTSVGAPENRPLNENRWRDTFPHRLLTLAGIVTPVVATSGNGIPLDAEADEKNMKVLFLDPGLLLAVLQLEGDLSQQLIELILAGTPQELVNKGGVTEMVAGLEMMRYKPCIQRQKMFYWEQKGKSVAEIDYLEIHNMKITPIEIKSGTQGGMKSLWLFMREKKLTEAFRCSLENFGAFDYIDKQDDNAIRHVTILPLYALSLLRSR
jgi:hypothetical protein